MEKTAGANGYFVSLAILDVIGATLGNRIPNHMNELATIFCVLVLSGLSALIKIKSSMDTQPDKATKTGAIAIPIGLTSGLVTETIAYPSRSLV
ncbi:hypothetical protein [Ethanoligenens harbinense]|uniref:hypothetical protein n=1 Tax=Ethanoligenens harbinense TaxID=253239 RepID=UPI0010C11E82|nr:hypothetical protein [Ethanoligenens harbinense]